jgi:hypothetical protein
VHGERGWCSRDGGGKGRASRQMSVVGLKVDVEEIFQVLKLGSAVRLLTL